jgi:predicted TIM-barrel fold metal-dependent hydrolase
MKVDVHQHVWTAPLIDALSRRSTFPFVRRHDGLTVLHSAGEHPYLIDVGAESPERRGQLVRDDGLDLALVAISSPIGIEALPRAQALELIDAHLTGVEQLREEFAPWGPLSTDRPEPADVEALVSRGCAGVSIPASALRSYDALDEVGPLLERVAERGLTLMVHPGRPTMPGAGDSLSEPLWWTALTDYVAQLQAAWLTFVTRGRREHPELTVLFPMLAGCAPLHAERLSARGGPSIDLQDPLIFYDNSSYGPLAIEATARQVGSGQLVFGSDRPVVEPRATGRDLLLQEQGARIVARVGSPL